MSNTFTTIQTKRSAVLAAPVTLANGELGYSFVSNTLFIGLPSGTPIAIASNTTVAGALSGLTDLANNSVVLVGNVRSVNFNDTATVNVNSSANGTQGNVSFDVNTTAIAAITNNYGTDILANGTLAVVNANINFNNTVTINVGISANGSTQGNLAFSINNAVPTWTAMTVNALANPVGTNCFTGTIAGLDTAGFWVDPFNIVHLRGCLTNTGASNIALYDASVAMRKNIANGLPIPSTNVYVMCPVRANGNGTTNVCSVFVAIYQNGAAQMINVAYSNAQSNIASLSWNVANLSFYGITYSKT